jgi:glycine/D-amino acid oxidase-like deaminating enzyme
VSALPDGHGQRASSTVPNGGVSYWWSSTGLPARRPPLDADIDADVCIVGGGLTGLWTAYYLLAAQPELRVVVLEREFAGFGASGRNGGWLSGELSGSRERYARDSGRQAVIELLRAMRAGVDEVISVAAAEGIDADIDKQGVVFVARNRAQLARLGDEVEHERSWGAGPGDYRRLERNETDALVRVDGALAGAFSPHCARVQPARLVAGLAAAVERRGAVIYEGTPVTGITTGTATTDRAVVRAPFVLRCLEGFTAGLPGHRRAWLPMNSSMIVTDPMPELLRGRLGWTGSTLLGDFAHAYIYAQRTADDRIALGGRGVPYRYGSRVDDRGRTQAATVEALSALLRSLFPATADVAIAHAWCGVLGVPRDWCATVDVDHRTGLGAAGGYVGSGLTTTNVAGRTLADLVLRRDTELTRLPWVGRRVRGWEPEPLRWLGVQSMYALYRAADRREHELDLARTSRLARVANAITGR